MEARRFYFTVHSASNLVDVRNFGEMKVYAKVSIAGQSECTEVDLVNKTNPEWNTTLCFFVLEEDIVQEEVPAVIELFCRRSLSHDKYVGELNLTLHPFYKGECNFSVHRNDSNQSNSFGTLKFSYELGDQVLVTLDSSSPSKSCKRVVKIVKTGVEVAKVIATVFSG